MHDVYALLKPTGFTPLEAIQLFQKENAEAANRSLTYAGRLDPIASGVLLLLAGEAIAQKHDYLALPKTYEAEIALGYSTDSYDILGLADTAKKSSPISHDEINSHIQSFMGIGQLPVPPYSSVPVNGKPLLIWAQRGLLHTVDIPIKQMVVTEITLNKVFELPVQTAFTDITNRIQLVRGDFRQQQIIARWQELLLNQIHPLTIISVTIACSSGTYIRTIANELGKRLGTKATLFSLVRTLVGQYRIQDTIKLPEELR